jgi:hypothetical protein
MIGRKFPRGRLDPFRWVVQSGPFCCLLSLLPAGLCQICRQRPWRLQEDRHALVLQ